MTDSLTFFFLLINNSLCLPHAMEGRAGGCIPALMQGMEVNVYWSYCQLPCGLGVGNGGGWFTAPFLLTLVSLHHITNSGAEGLEVLGAEVRMLLYGKKKKCSHLPAHWLPQERAGMYPYVSVQWAVEARQCLQIGLPTEILTGVCPKHLVQVVPPAAMTVMKT